MKFINKIWLFILGVVAFLALLCAMVASKVLSSLSDVLARSEIFLKIASAVLTAIGLSQMDLKPHRFAYLDKIVLEEALSNPDLAKMIPLLPVGIELAAKLEQGQTNSPTETDTQSDQQARS